MKLLLPLLLTPLASLQRTRLVAAAPASFNEPVTSHRDDPAEPDWRHAYLRLREQEQPAAPATGAPAATPPAAMRPEPAPEPGYGVLAAKSPQPSPRRRDEETPRDAEPMFFAPATRISMADAPDIAPAQAVPPSPTAEHIIEAVRQINQAAAATTPIARVWQVELPALGTPWQLHVEQARPQAPLTLELRVPPVAQTQARQQLGELDKRLRDAGHDVLRSRLRTGKKRGPVDGVPS